MKKSPQEDISMNQNLKDIIDQTKERYRNYMKEWLPDPEYVAILHR